MLFTRIHAIKESAPNALRSALDWERVSTVARIPLIRSSWTWLVITPAAVKLLSAVPETIAIPVHGGEITLNTSLPFKWQVLFIGALLLAIAHVTWFILCPSVIKNFRNYEDFSQKGYFGRDLLALVRNYLVSEKDGAKRCMFVKQLLESGFVRTSNYSSQLAALRRGQLDRRLTRGDHAECFLQEIGTDIWDDTLLTDLNEAAMPNAERAFRLLRRTSLHTRLRWLVFVGSLYLLGLACSLWVLGSGVLFACRFMIGI